MTEDGKDSSDAIASAAPSLFNYLPSEMSSPSVEVSLGIPHKENYVFKSFLAVVVASALLQGVSLS